jgi:hypothetical protein
MILQLLTYPFLVIPYVTNVTLCRAVLHIPQALCGAA